MQVYRGELYGSLPVAVKVIHPAAASCALPAERSAAAPPRDASQAGRRLWREAELLRCCASPYLVQLLGVYASEPPPAAQGAGRQRSLMLVTELLEGGSLANRLGDAQLRWHCR